jgi:hypothetical protein
MEMVKPATQYHLNAVFLKIGNKFINCSKQKTYRDEEKMDTGYDLHNFDIRRGLSFSGFCKGQTCLQPL